jgi:hypothetical protein
LKGALSPGVEAGGAVDVLRLTLPHGLQAMADGADKFNGPVAEANEMVHSSTDAGAPTADIAARPGATVVREYGVIHLRGALSNAEQQKLMREISGDIVTRAPTNPIPAHFHISSGEVGAKQRKQPLHDLGELLYSRFAEEVSAQLTPEEVAAEPSLQRISRVHSGEQPVHVNHVSGVCYLGHSVLDNHQDGPMPLYTMSVAIGQACDFVVGARPRSKFKNLRVGTPVTLRMESGDAIFFDGGSVPHGIPRIHKADTAPPFWQRNVAKGFGGARVSVLFREPDGK